jgi:hypothetical protein
MVSRLTGLPLGGASTSWSPLSTGRPEARLSELLGGLKGRADDLGLSRMLRLAFCIFMTAIYRYLPLVSDAKGALWWTMGCSFGHGALAPAAGRDRTCHLQTETRSTFCDRRPG